MLLTLAAARQRLWAYGPDKVPYPGTSAQQGNFDAALNDVIEEFLINGKWRNTMRKVRIPIYDGMITLPRELQSCSGVKLIPFSDNERCQFPLLIYDQFHEFHHGATPACDCTGAVYPESQLAQTFIIPDEGFTLRAVSTETRGTLTFIGGTDAADAEYFDQVTLSITNGTLDTTRVWNALPRIQKSTTNVSVSLYAVNSGTATLIAIYAPGETVPAYMRYTVASPPTDAPACFALCKLAFVPVVADTDIVYPGVVRALKSGLLAVERETARERDAARELWAEAIMALDNDRKQLDGETYTEFHVRDGASFADFYGANQP